jgi:hypothetical protein
MKKLFQPNLRLNSFFIGPISQTTVTSYNQTLYYLVLKKKQLSQSETPSKSGRWPHRSQPRTLQENLANKLAALLLDLWVYIIQRVI